MVHRPVVSVFSVSTEKRMGSTIMPRVFSTPLRSDLVHYVHTNMSKNKRQAYAISRMSGYQTSARSWGTGRALSRTPRVKGGGTHRSGQAAYANFCRAGGMFAPTRTWRHWHRKINLKEKRLALAVSVAATASVPLVMSRGHRVESVPELPLVLDDTMETLTKTRDAVELLNSMGLADELKRVSVTKRTKRKGKKRPVGPLVVMRSTAVEGKRAFRNIPGVDVMSVEHMNLLKLAPAGTLGRLVIFSKSAFELLDSCVTVTGPTGTKGTKSTVGTEVTESTVVPGTTTTAGPSTVTGTVTGKNLLNISSGLKSADVNRLINSTIVQSNLRHQKLLTRVHKVQKKHSRRLLKLLHNSTVTVTGTRDTVVPSTKDSTVVPGTSTGVGTVGASTVTGTVTKSTLKKNSRKYYKDIQEGLGVKKPLVLHLN
ncbi:60S ribosomal subunit protein L4/L1, putative [Theileria annulata]|uniref:60S ribosomal subunit protein L4/L1, putative n=1 Tax=Theileria annulata TaxID=5874 RepID=Q4UES5_THEAN|nr:60S ribosomal subunit protein L4/L1, putative [Theileria annulata]CAI74414.1 60S ribosomal subunit protein L4/L1, putative [Theileria annulata]|eukprot:XP_952146.1 60S ribosomal subunit protein L4/L1, putative [Theileria annulata]